MAKPPVAGRTWKIYKVTCSEATKAYIGLTVVSVEQRWSNHVCQAMAKDSKSRSILHKAIRKYGRETFSIVVIATASSLADASTLEQQMISVHETLQPLGYNTTIGGMGTPGFRKAHSAETRAKIGAAQLGRIIGEAARAKMSRAKKGRLLTAAHRAKLSAVRKGKKRSPQHCEKISAAAYARWKRWKDAAPPKILEIKTTKEAGISWDKKRQRWYVEVQYLGKKHRAGRFIDINDAIMARDKLRIKVGFMPKTTATRSAAMKKTWARKKQTPSRVWIGPAQGSLPF